MIECDNDSNDDSKEVDLIENELKKLAKSDIKIANFI